MKNTLKLTSTLILIAFGGLLHAAPVDLSTMLRNGDATMVGSALRLVDNSGGGSGSAFISTPITLNSNSVISTSFELFMHDGSGADGMTFVIQNNTVGNAALGNSGGSLGYSPTITNSVAVEFDTWRNGSDPDRNHVGIDLNGSIVSVSTYSPAWNMYDGTNHVFGWIEYDPVAKNLDVYVSNTGVKPTTPQLSQSIDLLAELNGNQAYFGFTAGAGGLNNNHDVLQWDLDVSTQTAGPTAVPTLSEIGKIFLAIMIGGSALLFFVKERRRRFSKLL